MSEIMSCLPSVVSIHAPIIQRPRVVLAYGFKVQIEMQVMLGSGSINFGDSGTLANQIHSIGHLFLCCLGHKYPAFALIFPPQA
jgi:hypothetical protein